MLDVDYDIDYPTSDGKPMAETDVHRDQMVDLIKALEFHFEDEPKVYVSGNILMFYEPGNKRKHRSPDVLVTLGIENRKRDNYKTWEEGKAPDLVFEITSKSTRSEDLGDKKGLYAFIGVREYVIFDPLEEYLEPKLRLYRRSGEEFLPVVGRPLHLQTVNLDLEIVERKLRLRDSSTGELLLTPEERVEVEHRRADAETERANAERRRAAEALSRAKQAEDELCRLKAQLDSQDEPS